MHNMRRTSRVQENQDMYSLEADLINKSQRELSDGHERDPITKLRLLCFRRGPIGILELSRIFRKMDYDGSKIIDEEEFRNGITQSGLDVPDEDLREMFKCFDEDGCGALPINDFLLKLRPPMPQSRLAIIDKVFAKMDKDGSGVITPDDVRSAYSVKEHKKYQNDQMTKEEIVNEFLHNFGDVITKEEFINYYASISASIDDNMYFDLLMRHTYLL